MEQKEGFGPSPSGAALMGDPDVERGFSMTLPPAQDIAMAALAVAGVADPRPGGGRVFLRRGLKWPGGQQVNWPVAEEADGLRHYLIEGEVVTTRDDLWP